MSITPETIKELYYENNIVNDNPCFSPNPLPHYPEFLTLSQITNFRLFKTKELADDNLNLVKMIRKMAS